MDATPPAMRSRNLNLRTLSSTIKAVLPVSSRSKQSACVYRYVSKGRVSNRDDRLILEAERPELLLICRGFHHVERDARGARGRYLESGHVR